MDYALILETLIALSYVFSLPVMLCCVVAGIVEGFFGYKIYKAFLRMTFAVGGGFIAYELIAYYLPVDAWLPDVFGLSWTAVITIVVAILAAILAPFIYKFVSGAIVGALTGIELMVTFGVQNTIIVGIVAGVVAILFGLLFIKIFKAVYILGSSFGGMFTTTYALGVILFPDTFLYLLKETVTEMFTAMGAAAGDIEAALVDSGLAEIAQPTSEVGLMVFGGLLVAGLIAGIVATVVQFKKNKEN